MFDIVSQGFKSAILKMKGQAQLTQDSVDAALNLVQKSLIDADVDLQVTKNFVEETKNKILGTVVTLKSSSGKKVSPGDHFIKICHEELKKLLGGEKAEIVKSEHEPTIILLAGLQGAGKTTHAAKLAKYFKDSEDMSPLLVAADIYRPAAKEQLKILGERITVPVFTLDSASAVDIAKASLEEAKKTQRNLIIIDTAGRLTVDDKLMTEISEIKAATKAKNSLLVIDSMIGQDAVRTAKAFDSALGLTGLVLTKLDGDARGGVALSVKTVTGQNILFAGVGEALDKLEIFRPEGMAKRILGMGDVVSLMDDFSKVVDKEKAEKDAKRIMAGHFDLNDFLEMTKTIDKMGPVQDLIAKTPLASGLSSSDMSKVSNKDIMKKACIIQSMTKHERSHPDIFQTSGSSSRSRMRRIAEGSGQTEKDVRDILDQFVKMRQMVQIFGGGGGGFLSKVPGLNQLNKMASMAKMAKMAGSGGMPNMFGEFFDKGDGQAQESQQGLSMADLAKINRLRKQKKAQKLQKHKKKKK
jgi:signal recognition particle subunit SRP54